MRSLFSRAILLTSFLTIAGILMTISRSSAQSSDNITAMTDKYWIDYESYLKRAVAEKNPHNCAVILNQMVKELTPKAAELNAKTAAWKKSHNQMEQIQLMSATQGNKHKVAALKYFMDPSLSMRSGQSEELHKAMKNMIDNLPVSKINTM